MFKRKLRLFSLLEELYNLTKDTFTNIPIKEIKRQNMNITEYSKKYKVIYNTVYLFISKLENEAYKDKIGYSIEVYDEGNKLFSLICSKYKIEDINIEDTSFTAERIINTVLLSIDTFNEFIPKLDKIKKKEFIKQTFNNMVKSDLEQFK